MPSARGHLEWLPVVDHPMLLAEPVAAAVGGIPGALVAAIDDSLADTAAFCQAYDVAAAASANCVIVATRRAGQIAHAAVLVLATHRADINGVVRRHLGARRISFAPQEEAVRLTGMEFGGITPIGLPTGWPILVDEAVARAGEIVIGSGIRRSKLLVNGRDLVTLPGAGAVALAHVGH